MKHRPANVLLPEGFSFSALSAGIKVSGRPDLALIQCAPHTRAASLFTKNRVVAAPVSIGRSSLKISRGTVRAVIVNSGNANCATGQEGLNACQRVCQETARILDIAAHTVFPSSTGIIGVPLPVEKIVAKLPALASGSQSSKAGVRRFADAILTTDTRPKTASASFNAQRGEVKVLGIAKGSGMIHPQLATMLVYLFTDIQGAPGELHRILADVCDDTFNCISVDGDTSTNDTVLLLASACSGIKLNDAATRQRFRKAVFEVCRSLAKQVVSDGEGIQHVIRLQVEGGRNREEARRIAKSIAHSSLVKTAWAGSDPNWGRILAAIGNSGVALDPGHVNIFIGDQQVCRAGQSHPFNEKRAHKHLLQARCEVRVALGRGSSRLVFVTTDLTADYVRINADYST